MSSFHNFLCGFYGLSSPINYIYPILNFFLSAENDYGKAGKLKQALLDRPHKPCHPSNSKPRTFGLFRGFSNCKYGYGNLGTV